MGAALTCVTISHVRLSRDCALPTNMAMNLHLLGFCDNFLIIMKALSGQANQLIESVLEMLYLNFGNFVL
jgi:hypothetical protein